MTSSGFNGVGIAAAVAQHKTTNRLTEMADISINSVLNRLPCTLYRVVSQSIEIAVMADKCCTHQTQHDYINFIVYA